MEETVAVIGLGYVGLPVACALGKKHPVIGFDINLSRLEELRRHHDRTNELTPADLKSSAVTYTSEISDLKKATFFIITVPTPIDIYNQPDLSALRSASKCVASALKPGDVVVYESTVYPGATEEVCVPLLEKLSGLKMGKDFGVGYSPERINPGDRQHTFTRIKKVVSGSDEKTLQRVSALYGSVVEAGIFQAASLKVAEAAKVIENTQRDVNIALINELSVIFDRLGIDTLDVLEAAGTKWNFLPFRPGLVGGHCIGVDPYYLTHKAESVGYYPQVILSGRRINNDMAKFIVYRTLQEALGLKLPLDKLRVAILGLSFKENCPDIRNSKVVDILHELKTFHISPFVSDPCVDPHEVQEEYDVSLTGLADLPPCDVLIFAVNHKHFVVNYPDLIDKHLTAGGLIVDIKGIVDRALAAQKGWNLWRL